MDRTTVGGRKVSVAICVCVCVCWLVSNGCHQSINPSTLWTRMEPSRPNGRPRSAPRAAQTLRAYGDKMAVSLTFRVLSFAIVWRSCRTRCTHFTSIHAVSLSSANRRVCFATATATHFPDAGVSDGPRIRDLLADNSHIDSSRVSCFCVFFFCFVLRETLVGRSISHLFSVCLTSFYDFTLAVLFVSRQLRWNSRILCYGTMSAGQLCARHRYVPATITIEFHSTPPTKCARDFYLGHRAHKSTHSFDTLD